MIVAAGSATIETREFYMIHAIRGLFAAAALFASPTVAASIVTPSAFADTDAPSAQFGVFGNLANSPTTLQFVVSASGLEGIRSGSTLTGIGFRFAGTPFLEPAGIATFSNYSVQIGSAARPTNNLSGSFAANMGTDAVVARSGALSIAAGTFTDLPGNGPNNFYTLGFTTPYTYSGGDLAVTLRFTPANGNPGIAVDAFTADSRINTVFAFGSATATTGAVGQAFAPVTQFSFNAVPEPANWALLIGGFALIGGTRRRRRIAAVA
jgi:hypothetical protein